MNSEAVNGFMSLMLYESPTANLVKHILQLEANDHNLFTQSILAHWHKTKTEDLVEALVSFVGSKYNSKRNKRLVSRFDLMRPFQTYFFILLTQIGQFIVQAGEGSAQGSTSIGHHSLSFGQVSLDLE